MQNVEREGFAGLNSDDEDRAMPKGDYRSATNIRNGSSDTGSVGAIENLKGNTKIEDNLPEGVYKTVGAYEDEVGNSIIYFLSEEITIPSPTPGKEDSVIWYGLIMRFFIDTEEVVTISRSRAFDFNGDSNIHSINLVGSKLYWTDGETEPKKINIDKGLNSSVPRKINILFPDFYEYYWNSNVYTGSIEVTDAFNNSVFTVYIPEIGGVPTTLNSFSNQAAAAINDQVDGDNTIVAEGCGNFLQIEFLNPGNSDIQFLTGGDDVFVAPDNFYKEYNSDVVNQIKASPACQPTFELFSSIDNVSNYVNNKNFQFAVRYVFDDDEKTTLSPYSLISYADASYGASNKNLNGIKICYTDERLLDLTSRSVIKQVELCFREGNGGKWRLIETIFQENIGVKAEDHCFDFYNNQAYTFLPEAESNINYHEVPKKSDTQEFVENRLYHGGITRGFDPVCVEAEIDVSYSEPSVVPQLFSIKGTITIRNNFAGVFDQNVIWQQTSGGSFMYGGVSTATGTIDTEINYHQEIPLGGFVVYLTGTDFYDITTQDVISPAPTVNSRGVYKIHSQANYTSVVSALNSGDPYQRFEIKNVPPGTYVMRVASNKTTSADLTTQAYQDTSTTVSFDHRPTGTIVWGTEKIVTITNADIDYTDTVEGFTVVDLAGVIQPPGISYARIGYLLEGTGNIGYPPLNNAIELGRAIIALHPSAGPAPTFQSGPLTTNKLPDLSNLIPFGSWYSAYTDHNGFFYITVTSSIGNPWIPPVPDVFSSGKNFFQANQTLPFPVSSGLLSTLTIATYHIATVPDDSKMTIKGLVLNTVGVGAEGVSVVPTFSRPTRTDGNGKYNKYLFVDTWEYDFAFFRNLYNNPPDPPAETMRNPSVYLVGNPNWAEFFPASTNAIVRVGPAPYYNLTSNPFEHLNVDITATQTDGMFGSGFKRGFDGQFGIIYRDNGSRVSQVFTIQSLQTHISFYTERNEFGVQENYGRPQLDWSIRHKAPEWATNYQWVRTKNESVLDFFQFAVNSVTFKDEDDLTVAAFADAVKVEMNLDNVVSYGNANPGSTVALPASIDLSWRVRFIQKPNGDYYDFFDEAVINVSSTGTITVAKDTDIEPEAGTLIEIYRPQRLSETKLYYEFGECYEVINGLHQGPAKSQSEWVFTDNQWDSGNLSFTGVQPHDFVVGQVVNVYQSYPYTNSSYNGLATITSIPTGNSIVLDKPWGPASGIEGGVIVGGASGIFQRGDVYYRARTMAVSGVLVSVYRNIEDPNISDFYVSEHTDIGRLHIEAPLEKEEKEESLIVFSDFLDETSDINKLNDFIGVNNELLPIEYGSIRKLIKANNVLLSICELRTVSLYINEAIIISASGDDTLVATDKAIGAVRAMRDHYGTVNPESVCEREGTVVFWDGLKGAVIQVSSNGLFPISSFRMVNHFNDISRAFKKSGKDMRVYGVHDQYFNDNLLIFKGVDGFVEPETVAYSNQIKRWISFRDYVPERAASTSMKLVTFINGEIYVHNSNAVHNNFYGTQYTSKINTVSNESAKNIKVFRAMSYESNFPWSAPLITIPANSQYKLGMRSRLKAGKFISKEGVYYSEFLKDLNSPGFATEIEALIDGRDLRGKVLEIVLESDNTEHTVLFSLNVKSTPSEMSNR